MKVNWNDLELIQQAVELCSSKREVLLYLGLKDAQTNYVTLKNYLHKYKLDTSHFHTQNHQRGKEALNKRPIEELLVQDSTYSRGAFRKRVIKERIVPYRCQQCENEGQWRDQELVLRLDHINGISNDCRLENLRFLCPNCDSQTDTYCGKNKK